MGYDIIDGLQNGNKLAYVTSPGPWPTITNITGIRTPISLATGATVVAITQTGTFLVTLPAGYTGTAVSGTGTVVGSPVTLAEGYNVITVSQIGNITINVAVVPAGTFANGVGGIVTGSPVALTNGVNNIVNITHTGTFIITLAPGCSGTLSIPGGGATVTGAPVALFPGANTIAVTALGNGHTTVTLVLGDVAVIEIPGLETIQAVIEASISGGYKVDPANVSIAGNKIYVPVMYYGYLTDVLADNTAIYVPNTIDLSGQTIALTVIGY